jgi:hypothetical protein
VTPAQALRKADAPAAGAAIGVRVPPKTRSAADIPELHGPWSVAVATGLVRISDGTVTAGQALEGWPPGDAALLDAWFAGLRAVGQAAAGRRPRRDAGLRRHPSMARVHGVVRAAQHRPGGSAQGDPEALEPQEDPEEPGPFSRTDVNRKLAGLGR